MIYILGVLCKCRPTDRPAARSAARFFGSESPSNPPTSAQTWDAEYTFNFVPPLQALH